MAKAKIAAMEVTETTWTRYRVKERKLFTNHQPGEVFVPLPG